MIGPAKTHCLACSGELPLLAADPFCSCGGIGAVPELDPPGNPSPLAPLSQWRWAEAWRIPSHIRPVSLGEGLTPLESLKLPGLDVSFRVLRDDLLPSGSWKDRGSTLLVTALAQRGVRAIIEDSSGNAALSLAHYARAAKIALTAFVPAHANSTRKALIRAAGADVIEIDGPRDAAAAAARAEAARGRFYACHGAQPLFTAGAASAAFNIVERLGRMPGAVLVPLGQGGLLTGLAAGFRALARTRPGPLPKLIGVQSAVCAPLAQAFAERRSTVLPWSGGGRGMCEGVINPSPARGQEALQQVAETGGMIAALDDLPVERAVRLLWREGLRVEPTAALPVAFLLDDAGRRAVEGIAELVVVLTGHGVRDGQPLTPGFGG